MKITVKTNVQEDIKAVWAGFNADLFLKLNPPFPPVKLLRFDGSTTGDEVHLEINFLVNKSLWVSKIVDHGESANEIYFIDEGAKLPGMFKRWKHRHRIVKNGTESTIIDEIEFHSPFVLLDYLLLPSLWLQFLYRKPVYKRIFAKGA